jgi:hypothetical protein
MRRVLLLVALTASAQLPQNPSPMVEHTRPHPRLRETRPEGRRERLAVGSLFLPAKWKPKAGARLSVHFHGAEWIAEAAAARLGRPLIAANLGAGSATYARPFADPASFAALVAEAETKAGWKFGDVTLSSWSAGYGATRPILRVEGNYARVRGVLLVDGLHAGYRDGKPGPLESAIAAEDLDVFVRFARDAAAGSKRMLVAHSEIFPGTFASTTETADHLLGAVGLARRAVLRWGPMGMQQLSEARRGGFAVLGYAGNSAPDHVDQLHALPDLLRMLKE